ncbi:MAG: hypothetical protein M1822_007405 [Bathelium mastoideum]|nr:MAG: hypothetical protein M1822_007405 [Bathelium mastoideum]
MTDPRSAGAAATQIHYFVQDLAGRYIRSSVLDEYIRTRLNEFGPNWFRETHLDHHRVFVARRLTDEELEDLQRISYPGYYNQRNYFASS